MRKTTSWPPLSVEMKSSEDESDEDAEPSPIETQVITRKAFELWIKNIVQDESFLLFLKVAFEVVDEDEAFWKLFPTKPALVNMCKDLQGF